MGSFYPIFDAGLTGLGEFIGGAGALGAFVYGFAHRMLVPLGLRRIPRLLRLFLYTSIDPEGGEAVTGELLASPAGHLAAAS